MAGFDHPENDLFDDADYANLPRPEPHSFDELADQEDPAVIAAKNEASTRSAIRYLIVALASSVVIGVVLMLVFRAFSSSAECSEFGAKLLCSVNKQRAWALLTAIAPVFYLVGSAVIMVRKLNAYLRWRPWMGVFWALVMFAMWVMISAMLIWFSPAAFF